MLQIEVEVEKLELMREQNELLENILECLKSILLTIPPENNRLGVYGRDYIFE